MSGERLFRAVRKFLEKLCAPISRYLQFFVDPGTPMTDPVAMRHSQGELFEQFSLRHSTFEYTLTPPPGLKARKKTKLCLPNTQS